MADIPLYCVHVQPNNVILHGSVADLESHKLYQLSRSGSHLIGCKQFEPYTSQLDGTISHTQLAAALVIPMNIRVDSM